MLRRLFPWALFPALVLLAFGRSLTQDFGSNDDLFLIAQNLAIRGITWEHLKTIFTTFDPELYIPLTFLSYQIDYMIGGLNPLVFHVTNLLLHTANSVLVYLLFRRLLGPTQRGQPFDRAQGDNFAAALEVLTPVLIFAVHPLHTEAVVWLSARKDLLSTFFFLLALLTYLQRRTYWVSAGTFTLALFAKVSVVTLPLVLLLLPKGSGPFPPGRLSRGPDPKYLTPLLPFFLLSTVFGAVALLGKEQIIAKLSFFESILMASKSTAFYLQKFFFPTGLAPIYPYHDSITLSSPDFFLPFLSLFFLFCFFCFSLWKHWHSVTFGLSFFLLTLLPSFMNFQKAGFLFSAVDRYAYVPSIGLLFLVAIALQRGTERWGPKVLWVTPLLLLALTFLAARQTRVWDTPQTLYGRVLKIYPESVAARVSLARIARDAGRYEEAFELLKEGLRHGDHIQLHLGAGYIYARVGNVQDAKEQFELARTMDLKNPEPLFALGALLDHEHRLEEARALYEQAITLDSSYVAARVELARLLLRQGDPEGALRHLRIALDWNPNFVQAHVTMAELFSALGDLESSQKHGEIAESLQHGSMHQIKGKP